jgi:hypothetical protein
VGFSSARRHWQGAAIYLGRLPGGMGLRVDSNVKNIRQQPARSPLQSMRFTGRSIWIRC